MNVVVAVLVVIFVVTPIGFAIRIWRTAVPSRALWALTVAEALVIVGLVLLMGRWDIAGQYTRYLLIGALVAAVLRSGWRHASCPWRQKCSDTGEAFPYNTAVSIVLFGSALVYLFSGMKVPDDAREFTFPLRGGIFMVAQGGGTAILNHHAGHPEQMFAIDFTAVNAAGFRAASILPREINRYAIFGAVVVSPCEGKAVQVRDGLPDLVPPHSDPDHPAGNHVVLDCGGVNVELAHLKRGSIRVKTGDRLNTGAAIGEVGNSGNTTEPHLHIHAFLPQRRKAVPITFDGRWPVRNSVWSRLEFD